VCKPNPPWQENIRKAIRKLSPHSRRSRCLWSPFSFALLRCCSSGQAARLWFCPVVRRPQPSPPRPQPRMHSNSLPHL